MRQKQYSLRKRENELQSYMKTTVRQFLIFIFTIVIGGNLFAGIIEIPKDAETIQTGLNIALDNDTILVEPGYYVDNLDYLGKDVVVLAFAGPDQTILYPADFGQPVVSFIGDEPPSAKFIGFTVYGMPSNNVIFIDSGASPHIYNNIFHSNIIEGIYDKAVITNWSDSSNPVIEKNIFYGNLGLCALCI